VRRLAPIVLLAVAGCGGDDQRTNDLRPAAPVLMTAAIHTDTIRVSPARVGAGTITLVVSNQSGTPQTVTLETDELGATTGGRRASSSEIPPRGTGRLTIDARQGTYSLHTGDDAIRAARVRVGPARPSSQDQVLLP
jgi:hypothetical protein